jgi:hypothetical protein
MCNGPSGHARLPLETTQLVKKFLWHRRLCHVCTRSEKAAPENISSHISACPSNVPLLPSAIDPIAWTTSCPVSQEY